MGADPRTFRDNVVRPALLAINEYSSAAERLVLATGLVESNLEFTVQHGDGPALGYFQIEPSTHDWLFQKFTGPTKYEYILEGLQRLSERPGVADECRANPQYGAAICRLRYLAVSSPLPSMYKLQDMAEYWKKYYNTEKGAGTIQGFMERAAPVMSL